VQWEKMLFSPAPRPPPKMTLLARMNFCCPLLFSVAHLSPAFIHRSFVIRDIPPKGFFDQVLFNY
jgi:hypothetical protein